MTSGATPSPSDAKFNAAVYPTQTLLKFTLSISIPILVLMGILLFTRIRGRSLIAIAFAGSAVSFVAFSRMLYEITMDFAGYPEFAMPVWAVFYLIGLIVLAFAFLFYGLHLTAPGRFFTGFSTENHTRAFLDAIYISLCDYIGVTPDVSFSFKTQGTRFLTVIQGVISLFINVVIIAKFVNTF